MRKIIAVLCGILLTAGCTGSSAINIPGSASMHALDDGINEYIDADGIYYTILDELAIKADAAYPYRMDSPSIVHTGDADKDYYSFAVYYYPNGCTNQSGSCERPILEYYIFRTAQIPSETGRIMSRVAAYGGLTVYCREDQDYLEELNLNESTYKEILKAFNQQIQFGKRS